MRIDVDGLDAGTTWYYRFTVGDRSSPVGRTRTLPAPGATVGTARVAVVSCQHYEHGFYAALSDLAAADVDLVVHLGDYLYADGTGDAGVRRHEGPAPDDLAGFRRRYRTVQGDPALQAAHASAPWIVTWDDNDVAAGWAGEHPRRSAAATALVEHLPVRSWPRLGRARLGDLADVLVPDTRSFRDPPAGRMVTGLGGAVEPDEAMADPARTMLGADQETAVHDGLAGSDAVWQVLASTVMVSPLRLGLGATALVNPDQWDGYPAARARLAGALRAAPAPVVVAGDLHALVAAQVPGPDGPVAAEVVGPSITSRLDPVRRLGVEVAAEASSAVSHVDTAGHGYLLLDVGRDRLRVTVRVVDDVTDPGSGVHDGAVFELTPGDRGPLTPS